MPDPRVQALFERIADSHDGTAELLSWRGRRAVLLLDGRSAFTLELVSLPGVPEVPELALVRPLGLTPLGRRYPDGPPVYVSPLPSAVLAVALRA